MHKLFVFSRKNLVVQMGYMQVSIFWSWFNRFPVSNTKQEVTMATHGRKGAVDLKTTISVSQAAMMHNSE